MIPLALSEQTEVRSFIANKLTLAFVRHLNEAVPCGSRIRTFSTQFSKNNLLPLLTQKMHNAVLLARTFLNLDSSLFSKNQR